MNDGVTRPHHWSVLIDADRSMWHRSDTGEFSSMRKILADFDSSLGPVLALCASRLRVAVRVVPLCLVSGLWILSCGAWADAPQKSVDSAKIAELVTRLRAPSFRERLQAEADCRETGPAVLPALVEALKNPDPELRRRAEVLIEQIEVDGLDDAVDAFLAPGSTTTLPGWSFVVDMVEEAPEFRAAYAEILRGRTQLARALAHPELIPTVLQQQLQNMGAAGGLVSRGSTTAETSALLMILIHPEANYPEDLAASSGRVIRQGIDQEGHDTAARQLLQALVTRWVVTPHAGAVYDRLDIASKLSLAESVSPALEMLKQKTNLHQVSSAFLAIIRFGGAAEMAVVETLLDDPYELNAGRGPDDQKNSSTQLRDLALVTLIAMNKQNPTDFGMRALSRGPHGTPSSVTASFESDAQREAAFEKWRAWSAKNVRKYRPLPANAEEGTGL